MSINNQTNQKNFKILPCIDKDKINIQKKFQVLTIISF